MSDDWKLGEAMEFLTGPPLPCACTGCLPGASRCSCQLAVAEATQVRRGAHIVVKLLAEYARKGLSGHTPGA